jgi:hypothetical protein
MSRDGFHLSTIAPVYKYIPVPSVQGHTAVQLPNSQSRTITPAQCSERTRGQWTSYAERHDCIAAVGVGK